MIGETYTFQGDTALMTYGKRTPIDVTGIVVYTEAAGEAFEWLRAIHETVGGADIYLRWSPNGGNPGDSQFSTGKAKLKGLQMPPADTNSGDPMMCSFTVRTVKITKSTVST